MLLAMANLSMGILCQIEPIMEPPIVLVNKAKKQVTPLGPGIGSPLHPAEQRPRDD